MEGFELLDYIVDYITSKYPWIEHVINYQELYPRENYYELYLYSGKELLRYFTLYDYPKGHKYSERQAQTIAEQVCYEVEEVILSKKKQ